MSPNDQTTADGNWRHVTALVIFGVFLVISSVHLDFSLSFTKSSLRPLLSYGTASYSNGSAMTSSMTQLCSKVGHVRHGLKQLSSNVTLPPWMTAMVSHRHRYLHIRMKLSETRRARFGNQLFMYAALYGIAWRNRRTPLWPDVAGQIGAAFKLKLGIPIDRHNKLISSRKSRWTTLREVNPNARVYYKQTESLPLRNVTMQGFWQTWRYFEHVEDQLRVDLTFKDHILAMAKTFLDASTPDTWNGTSFVSVVIHVRRTDLIGRSSTSTKQGFPLQNADYFNRSMSFFKECFKRVMFVVISDDINWCQKNIVGLNVVYSRGHSQLVDMAIASQCDHAIITAGSTYGWWVGWFANGITITQRYCQPSDTKRFYTTVENYYKRDWIPFQIC